ncbi:MAG TPA: anti-sigma factor [Gemmatimonadales bacterium]|jgi:predicted anti-sigma-YlaC factor YlaD|nr:anti-sigma factor [Gemmatimonadales bacterium]
MTHDQWTDRLSEYLDGELPEGDRIALEAHLQTCLDCATVVSDLRRVVRRARTLKPHAPPNDLWPAIAQRIGATSPGAVVIDLSSRRAAPRRWAFSLPQLAAAGIALMAVSGGTAWILGSSARPDSVTSVVTVPSATPAVAVAARPTASQSYAAAVADLEQVLAEGRGKLDSTTVKVIEQNLAAIDRAIAEAQQALAADSANLYLNTHLAETMRRKLDLLRQAAALVPVS